MRWASVEVVDAAPARMDARALVVTAPAMASAPVQRNVNLAIVVGCRRAVPGVTARPAGPNPVMGPVLPLAIGGCVAICSPAKSRPIWVPVCPAIREPKAVSAVLTPVGTPANPVWSVSLMAMAGRVSTLNGQKGHLAFRPAVPM